MVRIIINEKEYRSKKSLVCNPCTECALFYRCGDTKTLCESFGLEDNERFEEL